MKWVVARGSGGCKLGEVVGDADEGPFVCDRVDAAQEELSKASGLFDLSEDGISNRHAPAATLATLGGVALRDHAIGFRSGSQF